jgi:hypothetical protein
VGGGSFSRRQAASTATASRTCVRTVIGFSGTGPNSAMHAGELQLQTAKVHLRMAAVSESPVERESERRRAECLLEDAGRWLDIAKRIAGGTAPAGGREHR